MRSRYLVAIGTEKSELADLTSYLVCVWEMGLEITEELSREYCINFRIYGSTFKLNV